LHAKNNGSGSFGWNFRVLSWGRIGFGSGAGHAGSVRSAETERKDGTLILKFWPPSDVRFQLQPEVSEAVASQSFEYPPTPT